MNKFDILKLPFGSRIHFIGIGGISMSALAEILQHTGFIISGSDMKSSNITDKLQNKGIKVYIGHSSANVESSDVIVFTAAINQDNPEIIRAKELGLPIIERATLLGEIMKRYKYSIGVSGTHGKTTTTSMISMIFIEADLDPTITVGGELDSIGGNLRLGNSQYFITEACEYVESFLKFYPFAGIILNIDADHLDYFKDLDAIQESFKNYANLISQSGFLIANADDKRVKEVALSVDCHIVTYGLNDKNSEYTAKNISTNSKGFISFDVAHKSKTLGHIQLNIPGIHNVYNALAAIACSISLGTTFEHCKMGLSKFGGTKRRFEYKGSFNNATVIDDYAHHPTEVKATLKAAQGYSHNNVWCIFQPHTYTRTKKLLDEFSVAFDDADKVIVADIYAAREKDTGDIHSRDLVERLKRRGREALYLPNFDSIQEYLLNHVQENDLVITMGAGDIHKVGESLVAYRPKIEALEEMVSV